MTEEADRPSARQAAFCSSSLRLAVSAERHVGRTAPQARTSQVAVGHARANRHPTYSRRARDVKPSLSGQVRASGLQMETAVSPLGPLRQAEQRVAEDEVESRHDQEYRHDIRRIPLDHEVGLTHELGRPDDR